MEYLIGLVVIEILLTKKPYYFIDSMAKHQFNLETGPIFFTLSLTIFIYGVKGVGYVKQ